MTLAEPQFRADRTGDAVRLLLSGRWTVDAARSAEAGTEGLVRESQGARRVIFDLGSVEKLDTAGAWLLDRARLTLSEAGATTSFERARPEFDLLITSAHYRTFKLDRPSHDGALMRMLIDVGRSVVQAGGEVSRGVAFFGEVVMASGRIAAHPRRLRLTSLVAHVDRFSFRAVPIVALITFLVGSIVAQQGLFQLARFGASTFAVDLIGILVLRELAVLLTSIMIAGRSGSAITAEIGSMQMREEIDALRVMGLDPIEVLVVPRVLALVLAMPLLTFLADMSAIFGGLIVAWTYGGLTPDAYFGRLQAAIGLSTFLVGLIKAPFMALVIGLIATSDGFGVKGSAESLGKQVTSSVVKSIFMVIVLDGIFAMFFTAIRF